jgi:xanthine dehydrogenase YagS FAD-binding subunit
MRAFTHINATSLDDAQTKLAEYDGKALVNAGGTDLLGTLRFEILRDYPEAIINLKSISPSLDYIKEEGGMLKIGALPV